MSWVRFEKIQKFLREQLFAGWPV